MLRKLPGIATLLAGLGLCVGCNNMPIGNGQIWNRMTGRSCGETCPCESPCMSSCGSCGTCGYGTPIEAPGVLTSGGPALPVQMGTAGPILSTEIPNGISPRLDPQPPPIQQAQPIPANPLSLVKPR